MVTQYGMSDLGPLKFGESDQQPFLGRDYGHLKDYSDVVAGRIDLTAPLAVRDAAYAFAGWTVDRATQGFTFRDDWHDPKPFVRATASLLSLGIRECFGILLGNKVLKERPARAGTVQAGPSAGDVASPRLR
jgi:hypothetical protein